MTRDEFNQLQGLSSAPGLGFADKVQGNNSDYDAMIAEYFNRQRKPVAAPAASGSAASAGAGGQAPVISSTGQVGGEGRGGDASQSSGISNGFGSTAGSLNASNSVPGASYAQEGSVLGSVIGSALGLGPALGSQLGKAIGSNFNTSSYNGFGALDGTTTEATGPGTIGSRDSYGSNQSASDAASAAANSAMSDARAAMGEGGFGGTPSGPANSNSAMSDARGAMGEGGFGGNSTSSDGTGGTAGNSSSDAGSNDGRSGFYKGGRVTKGRLLGTNPRGPDDGYAALDSDEFIVRAKTAKKLGFTKLKALNDGRATIVMKGK